MDSFELNKILGAILGTCILVLVTSFAANAGGVSTMTAQEAPDSANFAGILGALGSFALVEDTDTAAFSGLCLIETPEPEAVNVLRIAGAVLVAEGFPRTAEILANLRFRVTALDNSELRKAEGALTCCSLLFQA